MSQELGDALLLDKRVAPELTKNSSTSDFFGLFGKGLYFALLAEQREHLFLLGLKKPAGKRSARFPTVHVWVCDTCTNTTLDHSQKASF